MNTDQIPRDGSSPPLPVSVPAPSRPAQSRLRIRFGCDGDPTRAFIAEAFAQQLVGTQAEVLASGNPADIHPVARRVMAEVRVPLRTVATAQAHGPVTPELVILIRNRGSTAPQSGLPSPDVLGWAFDDPSAGETDGESLVLFRRVRDEIKRRVDLLVLVKRLGRGDHAPAPLT